MGSEKGGKTGLWGRLVFLDIGLIWCLTGTKGDARLRGGDRELEW